MNCAWGTLQVSIHSVCLFSYLAHARGRERSRVSAESRRLTGLLLLSCARQYTSYLLLIMFYTCTGTYILYFELSTYICIQIPASSSTDMDGLVSNRPSTETGHYYYYACCSVHTYSLRIVSDSQPQNWQPQALSLAGIMRTS